MFRSKRTILSRKLWRLRVHDEAQSQIENEKDDENQELKSTLHSMLKRLKENQLEVLLNSIEGKGGEVTECVLIPKLEMKIGRRSCEPHLLMCEVFRWRNLARKQDLGKLIWCTKAEQGHVCCNPYHYSLIMEIDAPSPPMSDIDLENFSRKEAPKEPISTETGGTPSYLRAIPGDSQSNSSRLNYWCNIAYWEHRQRVGRLFTVTQDYVNVFQQLPHGDGMSLAILQSDDQCLESVKRTREKIGFGLTLSRLDEAVWMYNRSDYPIFVNSPTLDNESSRTFTVHKVPPGYSVKVFDYQQSLILERTRDRGALDGPFDPNAIRISFGKGWGTTYSRQIVTSCPCWLEILLRTTDR